MRALTCCLGLLLLLPQCGSGSTTGEAKSAADASSDQAAEGQSKDDTESDAPSEAAANSSAPKATSCDDGTCSVCGSGICPTGWYCDEKAGNACSWLAECADKPTCGCVTRVLGSACKCREEGGGLKVACD